MFKAYLIHGRRHFDQFDDMFAECQANTLFSPAVSQVLMSDTITQTSFTVNVLFSINAAVSCLIIFEEVCVLFWLFLISVRNLTNYS